MQLDTPVEVGYNYYRSIATTPRTVVLTMFLSNLAKELVPHCGGRPKVLTADNT